MKEYISREYIIKCMEDSYKNAGISAEAKAKMTRWIRKAPAADVREAVRGKWIWDDEGYHCSECFYHAYGETGEVLSDHWVFCPNCGARMEVDDG